MALYNIYRIRIGDVSDVNYPIGYIVYTKWNDATNNFVVHLHDDGDTYVATRTTGPDLSVDDYILVEYNFKFCSGSTLNTFSFNPVTFPYAERIETAGASECRVKHVCSVQVTDVVVTNATTSTAADGQAVVTTTGDDSPFYYSLNSDFASQQTSSTFTGLMPGNYTAYAKSQDYPNCVSSKSFTIGFDSDYGVKYRGDFDSAIQDQLPGYVYRIDILERGYVGPMIEVKMGDTPIVVTYQGATEDKYKTIIPSKATIQLMSESNFYFIDLFTGDERQYLVKFYINDGAGFDLEWTGYLLQQGYEEDYKAPPYVVTVIATDGLADLSELEYDEVGDKSLMRILSSCISQTDLSLNIRSAVNIYEENHDSGAADDPLDQTYVNTYFVSGSYSSVIDDILKPFGARIFQSQGYWWIIRIEDSIASSLAYREFAAGVYSSNGTESLRTRIEFPDVSNRLCWTGVPLMRIRAGYKNAKVIHNLGLENNLFYEGRLHIDDFNEETGLFNGIGVELSGAGISTGLQITKNGDSEHCMFIDFSNAGLVSIANIFTENKTIESDNFKDKFKLTFDYLVSPQLRCEYVTFDWAISLSGGNYYLENFTNHLSYNTIYTSNFFAWQKFEKDIGTLNTTSMQILFALSANHPYNGAASLAGLETIDTDLLDAGERRIALDTIDGDLYLRHYTLEFTTDTHFSPDIIEPDDYATSKKKWMLDITTPFNLLQPNVGFILLDNIRMQFFPEGDDPAETEDYEIVINAKNKENFEVSVNLGDLPDTSNAVHIYKNYFKLADGTPTEFWSRDTISESNKLLQILVIDLAAQNQIGIRLLNGQLVGDRIHRFHNCLIDAFDGDRAFANMGLEIDYLRNIYNVEMIEVKTGDTNEPPAEASAFTSAFSSAFDSAS